MTSDCCDTSHSSLRYHIVHQTFPYRSPTAVRDTGPSFLITAYCISALSLCALGYADGVGCRVRRDAYQRLF